MSEAASLGCPFSIHVSQIALGESAAPFLVMFWTCLSFLPLLPLFLKCGPMILSAPNMILVHQRTSSADKNWGCLTAGFVVFFGTRLRFRDYSECGEVEASTAFSSVYDAELNKAAIALDYQVSLLLVKHRPHSCQLGPKSDCWSTRASKANSVTSWLRPGHIMVQRFLFLVIPVAFMRT